MATIARLPVHAPKSRRTPKHASESRITRAREAVMNILGVPEDERPAVRAAMQELAQRS